MIRRILRSHANRFSDKRHFLFGNGPSFDPIRLQGFPSSDSVTFVCNGFVEAAHCPGFLPTFYCLADPSYADSSSYPGDLRGFYNGLFSKYPYTTILTSEGIAKCIYDNFPGKEYRFNVLYSPYGPAFKYADKYAINLSNTLEPFLNVLLMMLQFSIYLGGKDIELHGFDFSSIFLYSFLGRGNQHFYDAGNTVSNTFKYLQAANSVESLLRSFHGNLGLAEQLYRARQTAVERGITIKNCSPSTLLPPLS